MIAVSVEAKVPGPRREGPFKLVVIAISILLILILIFTNNNSRIEDVDDDIPDYLDPKPIIIKSDERWEGRHEVLANPIIVLNDTTLEIVDCEMEVELLELVLGNQSWFTVEDTGRLVLDRTHLGIVYDDSLESALIATGYPNQDNYHSISRVVDLREAQDPLLRVSLYWWRGDTSVHLAVQEMPGAELELIHTIEPDEKHPRQWVQPMFRLTRFTGTTPRLVIFTNASGYSDVLIGETRVYDGEGPLPNDEFPTGRPWDDGWLCENFAPFFMVMADELRYWEPLIEAEGEVTIRESTVLAPAGLPRGRVRYATSKFHDSPVWGRWLGSARLYRVNTASGGHIHVDGGVISLEGSTVQNVPIIINSSGFEIIQTELWSDANIMVMAHSHGTIRDSEFTITAYEPITQARVFSSSQRIAVAIAYNSSENRVIVTNCTFSGAQIGLDLHHATVELDLCRFENISKMAVWDHDTIGLGTWSDISTRNTFIDVEGFQYLRTHTALLELTGPGKPDERDYYGSDEGTLYWEGLLDSDDAWDYIAVDPFRAYLLMPTQYVNSTGVSHHVDKVLMDAWTRWGGTRGAVFDTNFRIGTVEFYPENAGYQYRSDYKRIDIEDGAGNGPGKVEIIIDINLPLVYEDEFDLNVHLDGELLYTLRRFNESDVTIDIEILPGAHQLYLEIISTSILTGETDSLWNYTNWYYRVSNSSAADAATDFISAMAGPLLLDPGMEIVLTEFSPEDREDGRYPIDLFLWEDSAFHLQGENLPDGAGLYLSALGNGSISLANLDVETLYLQTEGPDVQIEDLTCERLISYMFYGNHSVEGINVKNFIDIYVQDAKGIVLMNSTFGSMGYDGWIMSLYFERTPVIISDLLVREVGRRSLYATISDNTKLHISDSRFIRSTLSVSTDYTGDSSSVIVIENCSFEGSGSGLIIGDVGAIYRDNPISSECRFEGITISGEGAMLIAQRHVLSLLRDGIEIEDGAEFYVQYPISWRWDDEYHQYDSHSGKLRVDDDLKILTEYIEGDEWDDRSPIYSEGDLDTLSVVDPGPIRFIIRLEGDVGHYNTYWVAGFTEIDPTKLRQEVMIPPWTDIDGLIRSSDLWSDDGFFF